MNTIQYFGIAALALACLVAILWMYSRNNLLGLPPTQDDEPDEQEGHREESGADPEFVGELKALRKMAPPPELSLKPAEQMVADHEELDPIGDALNHFDKTVGDALIVFLRHQPRILLRLPSSTEVTGEMPAVSV